MIISVSAQNYRFGDNWWYGQPNDSVCGINVDGMCQFLLQHHITAPEQRGRVAVIDGGFNYSHPYLQTIMTDTLGWNFLGNANQESFSRAGTEEYRDFKRLYPKYKNVQRLSEVKDTAEYNLYLLRARQAHIRSYMMMARNQEAVWGAVAKVDSAMQACYAGKKDTIRLADLQQLDVEDTTGLMRPMEITMNYTMRYSGNAPWNIVVAKVRGDYELSHKRIASLDTDDDPHRRLGNNPDDFNSFNYGNGNIGEDAYHGTMVSGLIAEVMHRAGLRAQIVPLRAIPDGDEYDRDVCAAIRRAVDSGAKVVNMSFAKYMSPNSLEVQKAIGYANDHDVMLVHAAGNFSGDNDQKPMYPTPFERDSIRWPNMIVVAASTRDGRLSKMSCYGKRSVDVMAPGEQIISTTDEGGYDCQNGTSLSAPIVSGLAMVIRTCFPDLTAAQTVSTIVKSSLRSSSSAQSGGRVQDMLPMIDCRAAIEMAWRKSRFGGGLFAQAERMNSDSIYRKVSNLYFNINLDTLDEKTGLGTGGTVTVHKGGMRWRGRHGDYSRHFSADSLYYTTAIGHDMWLYNTKSGDSIQITHDGAYLNSFAIGGSSSTDRVKPSERGACIGSWIGKTHRYLAVREDKRQVGTLSLVDNLAQPRPTVETFRFAMPGDSLVSVFRTYIVDADKGTMDSLPVTNHRDDMIDLPRFSSIKTSGQYAYLLSKTRYQDTITLWRIDGTTGQARAIIREATLPHLNEQLFNFQPINEGREIIWWSERSGKGQYYLYDGNGRLRNAITPPAMVAGQIERIDTLQRTMILAGYGRENPDYSANYRYFYSVGLNGKNLICLTPKPGEHEIQWNSAHTLYMDKVSRMDMPYVYTLYNSKGKEIRVLARADAAPMKNSGRNLPQVVKVMASDGKTPLWGVVYTPWWMKSTDRLPLITNPYPGPHTDLVPESYQPDDNGNQTLADLGFVVINYSYRGSSPLRGRDFYTYGYQNLRDYAIDDDMATIRQLSRIIPQIDTTRVGIYGHSGGGFMTVACMLQHPEFYKVGVAASGNHDNNIYLKWWGETFHGRGHIPTNMELADRLKGHLLLIHGDMDNNVHPASTIRLANAFIKAGKTFDMLLLPGVDHGVGDEYYQMRIRYYMLQHLAGCTINDIDIINHH